MSNAGIALEPGVTDKRILANRVRRAPGSACVTVDAPLIVLQGNKIMENKP